MGEDGESERGFAGKVWDTVKYPLLGAAGLVAVSLGDFTEDLYDVQQHRRGLEERAATVQEILDDEFVWNKDALEERIDQEMHAEEHEFDDSDEAFNEWFEPEEANLNRAELNLVHYFMGALEDQETVNELGRLVRKDMMRGEVELYGVREDGTEGYYTIEADDTEVGGLVKKTEDGVMFQPYEHQKDWNRFMYDFLSQDDFYYASEAWMEDTSLAHFHLHAGTGSNAPSGSSDNMLWKDMALASGLNKSGLIVSFAGKRFGEIEVNVDFYNPRGEVVDLGVYRTDVEVPDREEVDRDVLEKDGSYMP